MVYPNCLFSSLVVWTFSLFYLFTSSSASTSTAAINLRDADSEFQLVARTINQTSLTTCKSIASNISTDSHVYYVGSIQYSRYIKHFMTTSNQNPACVFLPTKPEDVSTAIRIIGVDRTEFAISSGSHASNQGFSSTRGVHITLKGFQQVELSNDKSYVDVGPGNIWDNVYQKLEGTGVNVVSRDGRTFSSKRERYKDPERNPLTFSRSPFMIFQVGGRVTGVGVGGFILGGGGFSWKTNQYGLTIDTLIQADVVLPDGSIKSITRDDEDLFFALKGAGNSLGIFYNFKLKTNPQSSQVYGGLRTYTFDQLDKLVNATAKFSQENKDAKAQILPTFNYLLGEPGLSGLFFYDGPTPPEGTFSAFDDAKTFTDGLKTRSFGDLVRSTPANATAGQRGLFHSLSLEAFSRPVIAQILNQTEYYGKEGILHSSTFVSYDVEPFNQDWGLHSNGGPYPHGLNSGSKSPLPLNIYYAWTLPSDDAFWKQAALDTAEVIKATARADGQNIDEFTIYPNYAIAGTKAKDLYTQANADKLEAIRKKTDPNDVMKLTTFFDFTS